MDTLIVNIDKIKKGTSIWSRAFLKYHDFKYDYLKHDIVDGKVNVSITKDMNGIISIKTIRHAMPVEWEDLPELKEESLNNILNNL